MSVDLSFRWFVFPSVAPSKSCFKKLLVFFINFTFQRSVCLQFRIQFSSKRFNHLLSIHSPIHCHLAHQILLSQNNFHLHLGNAIIGIINDIPSTDSKLTQRTRKSGNFLRFFFIFSENKKRKKKNNKNVRDVINLGLLSVSSKLSVHGRRATSSSLRKEERKNCP
jgi:hypothetical protein